MNIKPWTEPGLTPEDRAFSVICAEDAPMSDRIADAIRAAERDARRDALKEAETIARKHAAAEFKRGDIRSVARGLPLRDLADDIAALAGREGS